MSNEKVSIIMGVYNAEKTIEKAINSIVNQTYKNWELIICDDCSSDSSFEIIDRFTKLDRKIILLKNTENMRLPYTLNKCIYHATGVYIARMDADDISVENRLEQQVKFLNENSHISMVGSNSFLFDENGIKGVRKKEEHPTFKSLRLGNPFIHPTIMIRKSVLLDLGGYTVSKRTIKGQDSDLWFRFFNNNNAAYNIQYPLLYYREGVEDYKRRDLSSAIQRVYNYYFGFKLLKYPKIYYLLLLKPLVSSVVPNKIMYYYHKKKNKLPKGKF